MWSDKTLARTAGFLYLIVNISGVFAHFLVRSRLVVPGDAAATATNIVASEWLFRIGFVSDLLATTCYFLIALILYLLLKPVNKSIALLCLVLVSIGVAIYGINMLNHFAALLLLSGADYLSAFDTEQLRALVLLFLTMHSHGYAIAIIFFGGWLLPLGYLVFKSGYFPKILGVLLMIACVGYLIDVFLVFLFPSYEAIAYPGLAVAAIAEISFGLWLLFKGLQKPPQDATAVPT